MKNPSITVVFVIIIFNIFQFTSCKKTCYEERSILDTLDIKHLSPDGTYLYKDFITNGAIVFQKDSIVSLQYSKNDTTYIFTYRIKKTGSYASNQKKY